MINQDYYIKLNLSKFLFNSEYPDCSSNLFKYLFFDKENKLLLSSINTLKYNLATDLLNCYDINDTEFELDILEKGFEDKNCISYLSEKYSNDDILRKKIAKKGRDKYFKYFNSTLVADFIIKKAFSIKSEKFYWE